MTTENVETYRTAIVAAFSELADARFTLLTQGWDSIAVDVDDRLIFKFPRREKAQAAILKEARLLAHVRSVVTMPVPVVTIHTGPPFFSWHEKLKGEHLVTAEYEQLPGEARQHPARDLARFYAEVHALDPQRMASDGAMPISPWLEPSVIREKGLPLLSPELRAYGERTLAAFESLPPDPHGITYGFFDGHGWNMAFDHTNQRLNGIYDFADSGFGVLHQEFIYSNFISPDLTERIVSQYETLTGKMLDRERIEILTGVLRLSELTELGEDPGYAAMVFRAIREWAQHHSHW